MTNPPYLQHLNDPQREAVQHVNGPLLILAGAGSGKTRVIVCRIAYLISQSVRPWNILAVTFTNKAAAEMRHRVDLLLPGQGRGAWVSTFHSFCAQFLRVESKRIGMDPNFVIYDDSDQLSVVKEVLKEMLLNDKQCPPGQVLNAISRAKDELLDAESYHIHAQAKNDPFRERVARVYEAYQKKLKTANAFDFGDLIMRTVEIFRDFPDIRQKYQKRFHFIMVDEYQDTNHAQYLLIKYLSGETKNVCVVGDDDQSIYSWRGATIRNILEFERDYPGTKIVKLEQNYRSTKKILEGAARLIAHNEKRKEKTLWTENDEGDSVQFVEMMNEQEEARFCIDEVIRLKNKNGLEFRDVAIFYRTNAQSRVFEDALRRANIPYTIVGALRFYERAEIKDALAYLKLVVNDKDSLSLKRVVNIPARGMGKNSLGLLEQYAASHGTSLYESLNRAHAISGISSSARQGALTFVDLIQQFQKLAENKSASVVVRRVLEESGYWDHWAEAAEDDPEAAERLDNLQELINAAKDFEEKIATQVSLESVIASDQGERSNLIDLTNEIASSLDAPRNDNALVRFLQEISLMSDLDEWKDSGGVVTLMTVHLAKGLEFPLVFVTGLEEGLFPIGDAAFDQDELEEERRLGYVAMTRAMKKLYLTCAASRRIFGSPRMNLPSRFIEEAGIKETAVTYEVPSTSVTGPVSPVRDFDFNQDPQGETPRSTFSMTKVGAFISHPDFGEGKITDKEGSGVHTKITVQFFNGLKKKLLLKYAPIEFLKKPTT